MGRHSCYETLNFRDISRLVGSFHEAASLLPEYFPICIPMMEVEDYK